MNIKKPSGYEHMTWDRIAEETGIPASTLKTRMRDGHPLRLLRKADIPKLLAWPAPETFAG